MNQHFRDVFGVVVAAIVLTSFVPAPAAVAAVDAQQVAVPWHEAETERDVIRGSFTQRKYLAELDQPLVSSGRFVVASGRGLLWQIQQPVQAQLVITREYLVRRNNGQEITRIKTEQQPALRVVAAILLAVFQADTDRLRQYFEIDKHSVDGERWAMTLHPKAPGVRDFIERIHIEGMAGIERIEIYQPSGDHSIIELQIAAKGSAELSAEERAQFSR